MLILKFLKYKFLINKKYSNNFIHLLLWASDLGGARLTGLPTPGVLIPGLPTAETLPGVVGRGILQP